MTQQVLMCSLFPDRPAVAHYRWAWGEEGTCCQEGQFLLQQKAGNLGQSINFAPLAAVAPPMTRDERASLYGIKLALEAELVEVKTQMQSLYVETEKLRSDNRLMNARENAAKHAQELSNARAKTAEEELGKVIAQLTDVQDENARLKAMMPMVGDELKEALATSMAGEDSALAELADLKETNADLEVELVRLRDRVNFDAKTIADLQGEVAQLKASTSINPTIVE